MKAVLVMTLLCLQAFCTARAQNSPNPGAQTPPGSITATNVLNPSIGTNANWEQLDRQLQTLRSAVEQTLPTLRAVNQQLSSGSQSRGLAGALESILSKNHTNGKPAAGQQLTNLLSALGSIVSTNAQGVATVNPDTVRTLSALEKDLQPVEQALTALASTNQVPAAPSGTVPSPTGR
jgi:hypothetical protein